MLILSQRIYIALRKFYMVFCKFKLRLIEENHKFNYNYTINLFSRRKFMKNVRNKFLSILVTLALVLSLCPANLAVAAGKTTLKTKSVTLQEGKSSTIVLNNKQKTSTYSFTSSKASVATVTNAGKITAVKVGAASIVVKETVKGAKKSTTVGTVSVKVTKAAASATAAPTKAPNLNYLDLSAVKGTGATYDAGSKSVTAKECMFSIALPAPMNAGEAITVTVKGKYNGAKGFRSWLVDDNDVTQSDIADGSHFPATAQAFEATYTVTAIGPATRLFFKGPSYSDPNVDDVTITSITYVK